MNKICLFLLFFFVITYSVFPQHHISKYEKKWAFAHPFVALKIKKQLPHAMSIYLEVKKSRLLDTLENGGKLDAFRHTYTMAFLARSIKGSKLRKLGEAHEKGDKLRFINNQNEFGERPDSLSCEMDLKNNEVGLSIGKQHAHLNAEDLKQEVINAIKQGKTWYIKRDASAQYTDCEGNLINMGLYHRKWVVPKCLIPTNK